MRKKPIVAKVRRTHAQAYGVNWGALSKATIARDKCCVLCSGTDTLTADHIIPVAKGGQTALFNLRTLCITCHIKVTRSRGGRALLKGLKKHLGRKRTSSIDIKDYLC